MSDLEFCKLYNSYTGEGGIFSGIDNPKQLTVNMTGEELKEWTEFVMKQANGHSKETKEALTIPVVVSSKGINYKKAFGLAMNYINESPCDPDITSKQLDAWIDLKHFLESNKDK